MVKKKILFCVSLIAMNFSYAQNTFFQIKLNPGYYQLTEPPAVYLNQINNSGFNLIISEQGGFIQPLQMSYHFSDELSNEFISVRPFPSMISNTTNLYNQLLGSTTTVQSIHYNTTMATFGTSIDASAADRLQITLVNPGVGTYVGTVGTIVETNNSQLNTVFLNFNVNKYENGRIRCNCTISELATALLNLTEVISNVTNIPMTGAYLSNPDLEKVKTTIYPNPFVNYFVIETPNEIIKYAIYDNKGSKIIETNSKSELDIKINTINSGLYFLNLLFENGQDESKKIIKK
jgi:Secretion system C-terminal sorting domain